MLDLSEVFDKYEGDEYLEFDRIPVEDRRHERPDLCGMLLLAHLIPVSDGRNDAIGYAGHDEVYFSFDTDVFASNATENDVIYLLRCGIMYSSNYDSFYRFT